MPVVTRAMAAAQREAAAQRQAGQHLRALAALVHPPLGTDDAGVRTAMAAHPDVFTAFPLLLRQLYTVVGVPHAATGLGAPRAEWSTWTLCSLDDVVAEFSHKRGWNPACVSVDFAWSYHGMGHYVVASLDVTRGQVYLRLDGGSNGWEQELNFQLGASYKPAADDCHPVEWWVDLVRQGTGGEALAGQYVVPQ